MSGSESRHTVTIKTLEESYRVDLFPQENVKDLKARLVRDVLKENAFRKKLRLIYMGKVIPDNEVALNLIKNESVVHCVMSDETSQLVSSSTSSDVNFPPARVENIDMEEIMQQDREFAIMLSRMEGGDEDDDTSSDLSSSDSDIEDRENGSRRGRGNQDMSNRRRLRILERISARIRQRNNRRRSNGNNRGNGNGSGESFGYQNFFVGFALGFFFGILILLFVRIYNTRSNKEMNLGIICGISARAIYMLSEKSGIFDEANEEKKYYAEEDAMFLIQKEDNGNS